MLNILESFKLTKSWKNRIKIDNKNRNKLNNRNKVSGNKISNNKVGDNKVLKRKNHQKKSKFKQIISFVTLVFFTLGARLAFSKLKQVFIKVPIFYYFDLE